jgi:hypothetical protein
MFGLEEGELQVHAGVPNTGKSEFVDALVLSLAQNHYWPICFASFEKLTHQHFSTLAEKVWGKPFSRRYGYTGELMTEEEVPLLAQTRAFFWAGFFFQVDMLVNNSAWMLCAGPRNHASV